MKEEAPTKKLPPKKFSSGGGGGVAATTTPTKNDEILSALLRINNFDSISSIKDESLDIDLSACVTISSDPSGMMGGNSLSSTDFWRVLDESAQNAQLELSNMSNESLGAGIGCNGSVMLCGPPTPTKLKSPNTSPNTSSIVLGNGLSIKQEPSFSGTFLRPEPPSNAFSPLKKSLLNATGSTSAHGKTLQAEQTLQQKQQQQRKMKLPGSTIMSITTAANTATTSNSLYADAVHACGNNSSLDFNEAGSKKSKVSYYIKQEPPSSPPPLLITKAQTPINRMSLLNGSGSASCSNGNQLKSTISNSNNFNLFLSVTSSPSSRAGTTTLSTAPMATSSPKSSSVSLMPAAASSPPLLAPLKDLVTISSTTTAAAATRSPSHANASATKTGAATTAAASAAQTSQTPTPVPAAHAIYKCLDCNELQLNTPDELATHESASHRLQYRCSACDKEFELESALKKHLKTHRSGETRKDAWKKCPDCGKCLKLGSMWMHRKIHSDNKKYSCDICGQKFVQKINLTHHARVHTAEKPYECPECQKRFQERSHLQRHQKYHAQTRSYRCDKCGKMYKTERCLKVHNLVHLEQRPFACTVCDKSFISNSKLKQHSNIHTGERPFKCNYCPRDFTNFPNWLKHTRRRHKVDHKTGEHLENIPSYCSKKSSKTTKAAASTNSTTPTTTATVTTTAVKAGSNTNTINTKPNITLLSGTTVATLGSSTTITVVDVKPAITNNNGHPSNGMLHANAMASNNHQLSNLMVSNGCIGADAAVTTTVKQSATQIRRKKVLSAPPLVPISAPLALDNAVARQAHSPLSMAATPAIPALVAVSNVNQTTSNTAAANNADKSATATIGTVKTTKAKRERKQPAPKQVQKINPNLQQQQHMQQPTLSPLQIKKEIIYQPVHAVQNASHTSSLSTDVGMESAPSASSRSSNTQNLNFPDLHCLSITSAEELIMEQALEMEECGLYEAANAANTGSVVDTDNAISADTATALHFKIKNEFCVDNIKQEEFISLSDAKVRVMCSSLESSPFSSPASASLELNCPVTLSNTNVNNNSDYFMPTFAALNARGTTIVSTTSSSSNNSAVNRTICSPLIGGNTNTPASAPTQSSLSIHLRDEQQQHQTQIQLPVSASQATLINQLYLPMTVNMPLLMQPNSGHQALPSVDTLLFANATNFFRGKTVTTSKAAAQHNL